MLKQRVAIKEFFVKDFCNRDETTSQVTIGITSRTPLFNKLKDKFIAEAQSVFALKHSNIVNVYDVFEENGTAYYVMDYIDGPSLSDILKREGKMSEQKALHYIRQVADALRYVHSKNRLHLDIKPGNIMVEEGDNAILIDFGASKQYDEEAGENTSTLLGKTPGYAPPEQMGNDVVKFTPSTDIYALGATLYKLLTGKTPISANLRISGEELEPLPSSISLKARNAVESSMQMNKKLRPQNIDEFLQILDGNGNDADGESTISVNEADEATVRPVQVQDDTVRNFKTQPTSDAGNQPKQAKKPFNLKLFCGVAAAVVAIALMAVFGMKGGSSVGGDGAAADSTAVAADSTAVAADSTAVAADSITVAESDLNGHECVDLGLSVKWATMNVGANAPEEYGDYFAWGEISPKNDYSWNTYFDSVNGSDSNFKKYATDKKTTLDPEDDAAHVNWGGSWRMPTKEEQDELCEKCTWTWTTQNGITGYKVTSKSNGNSIFLPAAGYRSDSGLGYAGSDGNYWSSSLNTSYSSNAYGLSFYSGFVNTNGNVRYCGQSVRAVCP